MRHHHGLQGLFCRLLRGERRPLEILIVERVRGR
jgi:hypothetical protein